MIGSMWSRITVVGLGLIVGASAALAEDTGTIKGKVSFEGTVPKARPVNVSVDAHCAKAHPKGMMLETVKVKNGGLADVFVQIKSGLPKDKKWEVPKEPVVLEQKGCEYHPHIVGVMAGQGVKVVNADPTNHNIHGLSMKNAQFNFSQAQKGMEKVVQLNKAEDFNIKCDVHNWMNAHAFVMEHPFFATTDEEGNFEIKNVPPGTYEVSFWHEVAAPKGRELVAKNVKVEAGKTVTLDEKLGKKGPARK